MHKVSMPRSSRRILNPDVFLVTPDFPLWDGGISTVAFELSRALHNAGVCAAVIAPQQTPGDLGFDSALGFDVVRLANPKARIVAPYYQRLRLLPLLHRYRPRATIACSWFPCGLALSRLKRLMKGPLAVIVHGSELIHYKFRSPFWRRRMRASLEAADILIPVSHYVKEMLLELGLPAERIEVVGNGVDPEAFSGVWNPDSARQKLGIENEKILLTVARLVARKGQDVVLRALPKILSSVPNVKYVIVGKGSYETRLRDLTRELQLESHVVFAGFVPQDKLALYYWASDVFVMPSRIERGSGDLEGFGISFLEANACGKPVVAGRSGGVEDAVIQGETGLLVDPESENEVAESTIELLTNEKMAATLGTQGRNRILNQFTWNHIAQRYMDLLGLIH
jgi:phosphatidylinositol alpha-1,6-mannosyltransferase